MKYREDEQLDNDELLCFECKQGLYLFPQMCFLCERNTTTFCMNYLKNARKTCNVLGYTGTILRQLKEHQLQTNLLSLKQISCNGFVNCTSARTELAAKPKTKNKEASKNPRKEKRLRKEAEKEDWS